MKPFLILSALLCTAVASANAQLIPIAVTGFTSDAIWGGGTDTAPGDVNGPVYASGFQYDDQTYSTAHGFGSPALPNNGTVTTSTATFQFQPYTSTNILPVRGANLTLTLSLGAQAHYQQIGFLLNNLAQPVNEQVERFTFNFSDATSDTVTTAAIVPYWVGGNPSTSTLTQLAKVALQVNPLVTGAGTGRNGSQIQFDEYDFVLSAADQAKILTSITVVGVGSTNSIDIYAVSGLAAVPEPSAWAMIFAGVGVLAFALRRQLRA